MPGPHVRRGPDTVAGKRESKHVGHDSKDWANGRWGGVPTSFVVDTFLPLPDTFLLIS